MTKKLTKEQINKLTNDKRLCKYPWNIESDYGTIITKNVYSWERQAKSFVNSYIKPYVTGGVKTALSDAKDDDKRRAEEIKKYYGQAWFDLIAKQIETMGFTIKRSFNQIDLENSLQRYVASVDGYSFASVKMQIGINKVDPIKSDRRLQDYMHSKIKENVSLIKSMNVKYAHDLENDIYRSINEGGGISAITKKITERTQMNVRHAKLIATDQTGKILGQMNAYRSKKAGAEKYIWTSMGDNRVRPAHRTLNETVQKYDDPDGGDNGQMPGEPINCRCIAVAIFAGLNYEGLDLAGDEDSDGDDAV